MISFHDPNYQKAIELINYMQNSPIAEKTENEKLLLYYIVNQRKHIADLNNTIEEHEEFFKLLRKFSYVNNNPIPKSKK
ncbi:MAG: hypothetical protein WC979_00135 [Candidatus Pacearchaeota archaeon]|jgi:hypothetical protein|nr:hypothetical protein [Clostridia bacterium]